MLKIITKETFSNKVLFLVTDFDLDFLEAIEKACDEFQIEYENASKFITKDLKFLVEKEAKKKNLLNDNSEEEAILEQVANTIIE